MTNEEIDALTDPQINKMVRDESDELLILTFVPDYCNDPAVMMPIVFKSRINLLSPRDEEDEWAASWSSGGGEWLCFDVMYSHAKPLRAAAIVYLKSKGVL